MKVSERLERYLARMGLAYEVLTIPPAADLEAAVEAAGSGADFIEATILIDASGLLMAVHRAGIRPSIEALRKLTDRPLQPLESVQAASFFDDCHPGFIPPLGAAWDLDVLVDEGLDGAARVCFSSGSEQALIRMSGADFRKALGTAQRLAMHDDRGEAGDPQPPTLAFVAGRLKKLYRLPPMPALARRFAELAQDPETHSRELADLVAIDPGVSAQVLRFARSGLFGAGTAPESLSQAIELIGPERLAHVVQGAVSVRPLNIPREGSLGLNSLWRHSLHCAFMCRALAERLDRDQDVAYLCGLLHNYGLLLTAWLYPPEFQELTALREINPEASMAALEQDVFGADPERAGVVMGHALLGGLLYRLWQLPEPVIRAAGMHQTPGYQGADSHYVLMVQLANALLKNRGIGDELNPEDVPELAGALGLEAEALAGVERETAAMAADLDALVAPMER